MRSVVLIFGLLFFTGCFNNEEELGSSVIKDNKEKLKLTVPEKIEINKEGIEISDSLFLYFYMEGNIEELVQNKYKIDSDLKLGISSIAFLEQGDYQKALSLIPHYSQVEFDWDDGEKIYPHQFTREFGFYELLALYRYAVHIDEIEENIVSHMQISSSFTDTFANNILIGTEYVLTTTYELEYEHFAKNKKFNLDSLLVYYPNFHRLKLAKAHYFFVTNQIDEYLFELKKIYELGYFRRDMLKRIISEYSWGEKPNLDSAAVYVAKFELEFPNDCDNSINNYYLESKKYQEMEKACKKCFQDSLLWRDKIIAKAQLCRLYLNQKKIENVKALIYHFHENDNGYRRTELRKWLWTEYFFMELELNFLQKKYSTVNKMMNKGFGELAMPFTIEQKREVIKRYYAYYLRKDLINFEHFYRDNFE